MLTYEQALAIAKKAKSKINHCIEYTTAYTFEYDIGVESFGGDSPIVVMKDNGKTMNMLEYALMANKELIRDFKVDD